MAVVAGALALATGLDEILYQIAMPAFDKYYQLGAVDLEVRPSHLWAWVALPVGLALHLATNVIGN